MAMPIMLESLAGTQNPEHAPEIAKLDKARQDRKPHTDQNQQTDQHLAPEKVVEKLQHDVHSTPFFF